jgi:hypothetical protein
MTPTNSRRTFLKTAGTIAGGVAASAVACAPQEPASQQRTTRQTGFNRGLLDALGDTVLPGELGADGKRAAVDAFVAWVDGYDPVAEEMHGYGYSDIRYLPADPAPAWRAQLDALDVLATKMRGQPFTKLDEAGRQDVAAAALAVQGGDRLPDPLNARHIAVALLAHWASSPEAWNLAWGAQVSPGTCRPLDAAMHKPLPGSEGRA